MISELLDRNIFIKNLLTAKSKDLKSLFVSAKYSRPYIDIDAVLTSRSLLAVNETLTGKQVAFQVLSKLVWTNSWIAQIVRQ